MDSLFLAIAANSDRHGLISPDAVDYAGAIVREWTGSTLGYIAQARINWTGMVQAFGNVMVPADRNGVDIGTDLAADATGGAL